MSATDATATEFAVEASREPTSTVVLTAGSPRPLDRRSQLTPPYTRQITGDTVWIVAGAGAWEKASTLRRSALVLPDGHDPGAYAWPVEGRVVVVSYKGADVLDARHLFDLLLEAGAARVVMVEPVFADSSRRTGWEFEK